MSKAFNILAEVMEDLLYTIADFIRNNLMVFAGILELMFPYLMYFIGKGIAIERGDSTVGGEIFLPIAFALVVYLFKSIANKTGKGVTVPLPQKRFTEVDDDGEVSIEHERLQELILYIADLEDWLERKHLI